MKLFTSLVSVGLLSMANVSFAQPFALFNTSADIDIANIRANHLVHGDMWWDPASGLPRCEFPKGSGKHMAHVTQLLIGGYDTANALRISVNSYPGSGSTTAVSDFWPGPIDLATTTPAQKYAGSQKWAKIWKINSKQIDTFLSIQSHTAANTPVPILEWPAKGNPQAKGNAGATLSITGDMAPFVDVNSDGQYDPLAGDYPKMKGNQMLWWIINDDGPAHNVSTTLPLKVEVKMSAYAFQRGTIADNIIFYEYELTNRSGMSINNFRLGFYNEANLGNAFDDYMGFDSTHRLGVVYNGDVMDGIGGSDDYGLDAPMMGLTLLELPGDVGSSYQPVRNFGFFNGPFPKTPQQYNDDLHIIYPDTVNTNTGGTYGDSWLFNECWRSNVPGDRRFILASNDMILSPGIPKKIVTALVASENAGGCPGLSFTGILNTADTAWAIYHRDQPTTYTGSIRSKARLHIYPNPATNILYVETVDGASGKLSIFDALGRSFSLAEVRGGARIDVNTSTLPAGVYTIRYQSRGQILTNLFVKE